MKYFLLLFTCVVFVSQAQNIKDKNQQGILDAERDFMTMAKEKNTRDAFVFFLADNAVTFDNNGPQAGKNVWEARQADEAWLYWEPTYSNIGSSGDFGFNTGPWEYRPTRTTEKAVAFGHFVTIWKKQNDGKWRAALDIGISHNPQAEKESLTISEIKPVVSKKTSVNKDEIFQLEKNFIESLRNQNAYKNVLSTEAHVLRRGEIPYATKDQIEKFLNLPTPQITYQIIDGDIASSGDLAYVYGTATVEGTKDGKVETQQLNYMRIWKKEDGRTWKLVLDILS
jgi:ketosteroid isomerase-like protein